MYKAIEYFTDLQDNSYEYKVGDTYPREGYSPSEERINELASDKNKRGRAVIEAVTVSKTVEDQEPADEEKPKKRGRKREE